MTPRIGPFRRRPALKVVAPDPPSVEAQPAPRAPPFDFTEGRRARRPMLTPLLDLVFLLLAFAVLALRLAPEGTLAIAPSAGAADWEGEPRLVTVLPQGPLLNGQPIAADALPAALAPLMAGPGAAVVVRPAAGTEVQALVHVLAALTAGGLTNIVVLE